MPSLTTAQNLSLNVSALTSVSPADEPFPLKGGHTSTESSIPSPSVSTEKLRLLAEISIESKNSFMSNKVIL